MGEAYLSLAEGAMLTWPQSTAVFAQLRTIIGIIYAMLDFDSVELERSRNSTSLKLWMARSSCSYTGNVCEKLGLALHRQGRVIHVRLQVKTQ